MGSLLVFKEPWGCKHFCGVEPIQRQKQEDIPEAQSTDPEQSQQQLEIQLIEHKLLKE